MRATPHVVLLALWLGVLVGALAGSEAAHGQGRTVPEAPAPGTYTPAPLPSPLPLNATSDNPSRLLPSAIGETIGDWQLSAGGRSCTLSLTADSGPSGKIVRFPSGCQRSLPVLGGVAGWLYGDGGVRLVDRDIKPVLLFTRSKDERSFVARIGGRTYTLVPQQIGLVPMAIRSEPTESIPDIAGPRQIPGSQPLHPDGMLRQPDRPIAADSDPMLSAHRDIVIRPVGVPDAALPPAAPTPRSEPASSERPQPGIYVLDRFSEKDVCRIALDPRPAALASAPDTTLAPARILPGCRDTGISVFEPVSWRFANGHMTLKAKRGHAINLVTNGQGGWRRDPDVGTTFVLRRADP